MGVLENLGGLFQPPQPSERLAGFVKALNTVQPQFPNTNVTTWLFHGTSQSPDGTNVELATGRTSMKGYTQVDHLQVYPDGTVLVTRLRASSDGTDTPLPNQEPYCFILNI